MDTSVILSGASYRCEYLCRDERGNLSCPSLHEPGLHCFEFPDYCPQHKLPDVPWPPGFEYAGVER